MSHLVHTFRSCHYVSHIATTKSTVFATDVNLWQVFEQERTSQKVWETTLPPNDHETDGEDILGTSATTFSVSK